MSTARGFDRTDVARCWAGFASFGAGLVHVAVVQDHLAQSWYHGAFFAVVGAAQVGWALWALSGTSVPRPRATAAATLALITLWAVSRTVGLALDPLSAAPESVGTADALAVVLELALIACIVAAMPRVAPAQAEQAGNPTAATARFVALLAAGALAVSAIATPAMAATTAGEHAHEHGHSH